ncbi:MAG: biopolymer transporter ExbD, partial [Planctomycetota bacterium]
MRIRAPKTANIDLDLTPMIDIVFQLIAFFMVINNFEASRADERVKLPENEFAIPAEAAPPDELLLNLGYERNAAGLITDGPFLFHRDGRSYGPDEVPTVLTREAKYTSDLGGDPADVTVTVRADATLPTGTVRDVIDAARGVGYVKFAFKATAT